MLPKRGQYALVLVLVALGIALSIVAFRTVQSNENRIRQDEFEHVAQDRILALKKGLDTNLEVLHSIGALYAASNLVERDQFSAFVAHALSKNSSIQALEWIPRVPASQRAAYEEAARNEAYPDFQIVERQSQGIMVAVASREEYFPVYYVEPFQGNEAALGFDLASNPTRLEALIKSRDSGLILATARITLVQETEEQFGILVFLPVFRNGFPTETLADRRENLTGFVLGVYRVGDIVEQSIARENPEEVTDDVGIQLYDRSAPLDGQLLFAGTSGTGGEEQVQSALRFTETFDLAGRNWEAVVTSSASAILWQPWVLLAGGLLLTTVLSAYIFGALRRTAVVERLVGERTL